MATVFRRKWAARRKCRFAESRGAKRAGRPCWNIKHGILEGGSIIDLLVDWFGLVCFANKNKNCQLSYSWYQTSQTGDQWYSDTSPFSIPSIKCWPFILAEARNQESSFQAGDVFEASGAEFSTLAWPVLLVSTEARCGIERCLLKLKIWTWFCRRGDSLSANKWIKLFLWPML